MELLGVTSAEGPTIQVVEVDENGEFVTLVVEPDTCTGLPELLQQGSLLFFEINHWSRKVYEVGTVVF